MVKGPTRKLTTILHTLDVLKIVEIDRLSVISDEIFRIFGQNGHILLEKGTCCQSNTRRSTAPFWVAAVPCRPVLRTARKTARPGPSAMLSGPQGGTDHGTNLMNVALLFMRMRSRNRAFPENQIIPWLQADNFYLYSTVVNNPTSPLSLGGGEDTAR